MTASQCTKRLTSLRAATARPWILRLFDRLVDANARHRQHQALLRLDDALLRDIGLTRGEADSEASQTVWDAPPHWRG